MKTYPDKLHKSYIRKLEDCVTKYVSILETIFGPCDPRFVFGTIGRSKDERACIYFPEDFHLNGGCRVDIHITNWPWEHHKLNQGPWQVAHECVHLLDPGRGSTNILEEGLATWFQNEACFHSELVQHYIAKNDSNHTSAYLEARDLVHRSLPNLLHAVRTLRDSGTRIRDIRADMLTPLLPDVETGVVEHLCSSFNS